MSAAELGRLATASPTSFTVAPVPYLEARAFVSTLHYSGGMSAGPKCFGLYHGSSLIGVCAFATPIGETVRACVFGPEHVDRVTELHRLVLLDEAPRNSESFFIARALKGLKEVRPQTWAVISYADSSAGHRGTIYQATNALYCGTASARNQYRDATGRLRPHRQDGVEITRKQAAEWGWSVEKRGVKYRYLFLTPDSKSHAKQLRQKLLLAPTSYPTEGSKA